MQISVLFQMVIVLVVTLLLVSHADIASANNGVVFCYYGSWANRRQSVGRFGINDIPLNLCTHVVYSFIGLSPTGELVHPTEETLEGKSNSLANFSNLKSTNPNVKLMVAVGGENAGSSSFSPVVHDDTLRATFITNMISFLETYNLDGMDLDWEFPAQNGGIPSDKEKFAILVREFKEAFTSNNRNYILSAAVGVLQANINRSYDVVSLNQNLDYINLMLYNYHGSWNLVTGANAPLYPQLTDQFTALNVNNSVNLWISNGASPSKLVLGMGSYGKTFTLNSTNDVNTGAPATGAGIAGPYLNSVGSWSYYEICDDQKNNPNSWSITQVANSYVYANKGTFWVGYDNPNTIYAKGEYAKSKDLAGIMFWAVDLDDFNALCEEEPYPLIRSGIAGYNA